MQLASTPGSIRLSWQCIALNRSRCAKESKAKKVLIMKLVVFSALKTWLLLLICSVSCGCSLKKHKCAVYITPQYPNSHHEKEHFHHQIYSEAFSSFWAALNVNQVFVFITLNVNWIGQSLKKTPKPFTDNDQIEVIDYTPPRDML